MRTLETEIIDLTLTQAIERYMEMETFDDAHEAIVEEWPEQIAVLLIEFLDNLHCGQCGKNFELLSLNRDNGDSHYIVFVCTCPC